MDRGRGGKHILPCINRPRIGNRCPSKAEVQERGGSKILHRKGGNHGRAQDIILQLKTFNVGFMAGVG